MSMLHLKQVSFAAVVVLAFAGLAVAADKPTPVKATNTWKGSVDDEKLMKEMPDNGVITNAKDWEKLVKAWKVADKAPEVNFDKELILIATTTGSKLNLSASLDDKGDMKALGFGTRDLAPGFRYVIISVPKDGVKTVNGKELPK
jgi:hypothetical protein